MACPTCDHSMEACGQNDRGDNFFHCPRCGTLKIDAFGQHGDKLYVPKLVERCREFRATRHPSFKAEVGIFGDPVLVAEWERIGIAESINVPANRTK